MMMRKFSLAAIGWMMANLACAHADLLVCDIVAPSSICVNGPAAFTMDCFDDYFDIFQWSIDGVVVATQETSPSFPVAQPPTFYYTFTTPGTHSVKLGVFCQDELNCGAPRMMYRTITVNVTDIPAPSITASTATTFCNTGSVTLSVASPIPGRTYAWRSVPAGFAATGTSATFNNITASTQFFVKAVDGTCFSQEVSAAVSVITTQRTPALGEENLYHKHVIKTNSGSSHYWQTQPGGTDQSHPVAGDYTVFESGDYYIRRYHAPATCWAAPTGPVHVTISHTPPLAEVQLVQRSGYTEVVLANDDREHLLTYADYFLVSNSSPNPAILKALNTGLAVTGGILLSAGTYYVKGRDKGTQTWGPTLTIQVSLRGDEGVNWVHIKSFDGTSETTPYAESKSYFGEDGGALQTQTKTHPGPGNSVVFTSTALRDRFDRVVGGSLPAPIRSSDFLYQEALLLTPVGKVYDHTDFDWTDPSNPSNSTVYNPVEAGNDEPGTVGWYYSENNEMPGVPKTRYPYSRTEFYADGTGEVKRSAGPGETLRLGSGHEVESGTFPVYHELDDYLEIRKTNVLPGISQPAQTLLQAGVQTIVRDQNGRYAISITDKEGKNVLSARKGTATEHTLAVTNAITSSADPQSEHHRLLTYFYLLDPQVITLTPAPSGATQYIVEDLLSGRVYTPQSSVAWPAGFYRIVLKSGAVSFSFTNYFTDVSCQFYDDAGRPVSSVSPNGYARLKKPVGAVPYASIDKTTSKYNFRGWLMETTEVDAGTTHYRYRNDGSIRFSQSALQASQAGQVGKGKFSYTHYDAVGRPVESGEYIGATAFSAVTNQVEYADQVAYDAADKKDWVTTLYDNPDQHFHEVTGLPSEYDQLFVRGAVSKTGNANMQTWYSYDELGRVVWMAQKPTKLPRVFVVKYTYDFLGNVLQTASLSYNTQGALLTEFYHHYAYDLDKRLAQASTSATADGPQKVRATYEYYLHGPLKRIVLGENIQGIDFVYNIHGWLTQINHPDNSQDPGQDGASGSDVRKDAFGMVLDYYESELGTLYRSSMATPNHNVHGTHALVAQYEGHTPLIRFDVEAPIAHPMQPKTFSAENPRYRRMLQSAGH